MRRWWGSAIILHEQGGIWVQTVMRHDVTSVRKNIPETGNTISPGQKEDWCVERGEEQQRPRPEAGRREFRGNPRTLQRLQLLGARGSCCVALSKEVTDEQ